MNTLKPISSYPPASFFRRAAAFIYDSFILFSFWILITALALVINRGGSFLPHQAIFLSYLFLTTGLFLSFFWCKRGQTLGMLAWSLILVNEKNLPLSWSQAFKRYLFCYVSLALFGVGFLCGLHDKLAKTKILKAR